MKAIICTRYGPPEVLQPVDREKPVPKDSEILVKIKATTVTVADTRVRSFTVPAAYWLPARLLLGLAKPKKPVLGVELSGVVEAVGGKVQRFRVGDAITAATLNQFGGYAEYICLPENGCVDLKPNNLSFEEAAALPIGAQTALHYLRKARIQTGQKVLIYGASGSVGTYAVQLAAYFGAEVTGVCSAANAALVRSLGATQVFDYTQPAWADNAGTYDIVFVAVDKLPFSIAASLVQPEGVYINITQPVKSLPMLATTLFTKKKVFVGENAPETDEALSFLHTLVETELLRPVIDRCYPLDEVVEAHRYVDKGHKKGNVAIRVE